MVGSRILLAYVVVATVNLIAAATDLRALAAVSKLFLIPLLLAWLLSQGRGRMTPPLRWLMIGLLFAWAGDILLIGDGDLYFAAGLASFLAMQLCYIRAFTCVPGPGLVRAWKVILVPFVIIWLAVNIAISSGVGVLRIPVLVYSAVLVTMAVVAVDLVLRVPRPQGRQVAWGAIAFMVSDGLIALTQFGPLSPSPMMNAAVMGTYVLAQGLIVVGFTTAVRARATPSEVIDS